MTVDPDVLTALSTALSELHGRPQRPVPISTVEALAHIAKPGMRLKIHLDASQAIGAPLVTLEHRSSDSDFLSALTKRQKQVARLLIDGQSNRQISESLGISIGTVKDHVHAILRRLDLPSRVAVISASRSFSTN